MKGPVAFSVRRKDKKDQLLSSPQITQDPIPVVRSNVNVKHEREQEETLAAKKRTFIEKFMRFANVLQLHREANRGDISNAPDQNLMANSRVKIKRPKAFRFAPLADADIKSNQGSGFSSQNSGSDESEGERKSGGNVSENKNVAECRATQSFFPLQGIKRTGRNSVSGSQFRRLQQENDSANLLCSRNFTFDNFGLSLETDDVPVALKTARIVQDV
uniref:Uncharacterized protein n=1 Tax=Schistocephalus solidus TaxID=70667 RepID=A0A0X3PIC2_SCHSO